MQTQSNKRHKPKITVGATDHARLSSLAASALDRLPETADELLAELDRAHVAADRSVPANVVQMGSRVTFKPDTGEQKTVTLVFPADADISTGKVSVLTPIGTALLGLERSVHELDVARRAPARTGRTRRCPAGRDGLCRSGRVSRPGGFREIAACATAPSGAPDSTRRAIR